MYSAPEGSNTDAPITEVERRNWYDDHTKDSQVESSVIHCVSGSPGEMPTERSLEARRLPSWGLTVISAVRAKDWRSVRREAWIGDASG